MHYAVDLSPLPCHTSAMTRARTPADTPAADLIQPDRGQAAVALHVVDKAGFAGWLAGRGGTQRAVIAAQKFTGAAGALAVLPEGADGWCAVLGAADARALTGWCLAGAAEKLPAGAYRLVVAGEDKIDDARALAGWVLGQYRFDRYRKAPAASEDADEGPRVLLTHSAKAVAPALAEAAAVALVRDLVNTPAEDMGPAALEREAEILARRHPGAVLKVTRGEALEQGFPAVHMVGRAAMREASPRMIEIEWGDPSHPRVAIIGKGVCFDSGGLDLKPSSAMLLMKKDMGGAAHALALARLVMAEGLKVRLHLLIPAVENAVSGSAFRPGDVLASRAGISIEIGNTDAEGRLVLADALARAAEEKPALIIDFATLTGAARVALGPDLPALFTSRDDTAAAFMAAGAAHDDPVWRLPLHAGYGEYLKSDIADLNNSPSNGFAGAIAAALFLERFVPEGADWVHLDTFAWRPSARPGRPRGGDALGLRAAWAVLRGRYA